MSKLTYWSYMNDEKIKGLLARRDQVRDRLYAIIRANPPDSLVSLAREIRINIITFKRFLDGGDETSFITLLKIEKWCDDVMIANNNSIKNIVKRGSNL
jgi:hypothetical protein